MKKPENTTIEPEVITELRKRVAKANALAAEYNVADNINHSPAAFMSAVLREYDNVVNLYTSHSYLHRVVNDIATALGYRMGDTFEPEALVKKVEHLLGDMYELQLRDEVQHRAIYRIATLMGYNTDDVIDLNELVEKVEQLVAYAELAKENSTAMATLAAAEAERDMVIAACRGTQMDAAGIRAVEDLTKRITQVEAERDALRTVVIATGAWKSAPCCICGYNGAGYFNPQTHHCAALAAEKEVHL